MNTRELQPRMVLTLETGEQWKLIHNSVDIICPDDPSIAVENRRRNKWLAERLPDGKETLLCFDCNTELPAGVLVSGPHYASA